MKRGMWQPETESLQSLRRLIKKTKTRLPQIENLAVSTHLSGPIELSDNDVERVLDSIDPYMVADYQNLIKDLYKFLKTLKLTN